MADYLVTPTQCEEDTFYIEIGPKSIVWYRYTYAYIILLRVILLAFVSRSNFGEGDRLFYVPHIFISEVGHRGCAILFKKVRIEYPNSKPQ